MERGFRGSGRALYHPLGQSASAEAPGEQRNPQELSSCPYRGKTGPGVSQGPTALRLAQELPCAVSSTQSGQLLRPGATSASPCQGPWGTCRYRGREE